MKSEQQKNKRGPEILSKVLYRGGTQLCSSTAAAAIEKGRSRRGFLLRRPYCGGCGGRRGPHQLPHQSELCRNRSAFIRTENKRQNRRLYKVTDIYTSVPVNHNNIYGAQSIASFYTIPLTSLSYVANPTGSLFIF